MNTRMQSPRAAALLNDRSITLRLPTNWTGVIFFATLGLLHFCIALPAFLNRRWEGYLSAAMCLFFLGTAIVLRRLRNLVTFDGRRRVILMRAQLARFRHERAIPFDAVHAVRFTSAPYDRPAARVEVLCDNEDIECHFDQPSRRDALCLAMLMNVRLIHVWPSDEIESPNESPDEFPDDERQGANLER